MGRERIIIAGGTGSLGTCLAEYFSRKNRDVIILTRSAKAPCGNISFRAWDGRTLGGWAGELEGALCVINLSGRTVNCRYTEENKKQIIDSRVESTLTIGKAIRNCSAPPGTWINAGSAAIYGDTGERTVDEDAPFAEGFSPGVCKKWEAAFAMSETPGTRKIVLRIGLVLSETGGVLDPLLHLARWGLAGTVGNGKQGMSWIHERDFCRLADRCIADPSLSGPLNACSPHPVSNREFMRTLRTALGKPFALPSPAFAVKIGAFFMGTEPDLVLKGRRVVSKILKQKDFQFEFPEILPAMNDIISKTKNRA